VSREISLHQAVDHGRLKAEANPPTHGPQTYGPTANGHPATNRRANGQASPAATDDPEFAINSAHGETTTNMTIKPPCGSAGLRIPPLFQLRNAQKSQIKVSVKTYDPAQKSR
jgi:hypothetical protein